MEAALGGAYDRGMDLFDHALLQALRHCTPAEFAAWLERQRGCDWTLEDEAELQTRLVLLRARQSSRHAVPADDADASPRHH